MMNLLEGFQAKNCGKVILNWVVMDEQSSPDLTVYSWVHPLTIPLCVGPTTSLVDDAVLVVRDGEKERVTLPSLTHIALYSLVLWLGRPVNKSLSQLALVSHGFQARKSTMVIWCSSTKSSQPTT